MTVFTFSESVTRVLCLVQKYRRLENFLDATFGSCYATWRDVQTMACIARDFLSFVAVQTDDSTPCSHDEDLAVDNWHRPTCKPWSKNFQEVLYRNHIGILDEAMGEFFL